MKKIVAFILIIVALVWVNYYEHHYTREDCVVIQINNGVATFEDKGGHLWGYDADGLKIGDVADLKMHDSCSSGVIEDDIIEKVILK